MSLEKSFRVSDGQPRRFVRVVKLTGSMIFFVAMSVRRAFRRLAGRAPAQESIVLYYHSVPDHERAAFARQMDMLLRMGRPVDIRSNSVPSGSRRSIAVTFDDAFENVARNAVPELVARKIPAAIFVVTRVLGGTAAWWPEGSQERSERIATLAELKQLPESIVLGSHTLTHPVLTMVDSIQARREITESRFELEKLLGRPVTTFSFPFGAFSDELIESAREAGYERVFTTLADRSLSDFDRFALGRVKADPSDWHLEFYLKCSGAYCWLPWAIRLKREARSGPWMGKRRAVRKAAAHEPAA